MTLGSHFLLQRGSPLMGIARAEKPGIETLPAKRFHTRGNSGGLSSPASTRPNMGLCEAWKDCNGKLCRTRRIAEADSDLHY